MGKKLIIGFFIFVGLFVAIVGPLGFMQSYKYYYSFPWIRPEGRIIFTSNRFVTRGNAMAVLEGGVLKDSAGGLRPRFIRSSGGTISWGGITDNTLSISDNKLAQFEKLEFFKQFDPSYFDISPDGNRICFTSIIRVDKTDSRQHPFNLFVVNRDGTGLKQLTYLKKNYSFETSYPRWSPDGSRILFEYLTVPESKTNSAISLYTIKPDGSDLKDVIGDGSTFKLLRMDPSWSPDGKRIAFVTYENPGKDGYSVYIVDSDGKNIKRITSLPYNCRRPVFSPDGKQICFVAYPNGGPMGGGQLFIVDVATKQVYRVTKPGYVKAWPYKANDDDPDWHS